MTPDLSSFRCRRCGACCRIPGGLVRLREGESAALAAVLGMDERTFLDEHTLLAPDRRSLVLRDHADGSCEMLGEDGLCRVHAAKPAQCREFPFRWRNPDSARICPGLRELELDISGSINQPTGANSILPAYGLPVKKA